MEEFQYKTTPYKVSMNRFLRVLKLPLIRLPHLLPTRSNAVRETREGEGQNEEQNSSPDLPVT